MLKQRLVKPTKLQEKKKLSMINAAINVSKQANEIIIEKGSTLKKQAKILLSKKEQMKKELSEINTAISASEKLSIKVRKSLEENRVELLSLKKEVEKIRAKKDKEEKNAEKNAQEAEQKIQFAVRDKKIKLERIKEKIIVVENELNDIKHQKNTAKKINDSLINLNQELEIKREAIEEDIKVLSHKLVLQGDRFKNKQILNEQSQKEVDKIKGEIDKYKADKIKEKGLYDSIVKKREAEEKFFEQVKFDKLAMQKEIDYVKEVIPKMREFAKKAKINFQL